MISILKKTLFFKCGLKQNAVQSFALFIEQN